MNLYGIWAHLILNKNLAITIWTLLYPNIFTCIPHYSGQQSNCAARPNPDKHAIVKLFCLTYSKTQMKLNFWQKIKHTQTSLLVTDKSKETNPRKQKLQNFSSPYTEKYLSKKTNLNINKATNQYKRKKKKMWYIEIKSIQLKIMKKIKTKTK